MQKEVVDAYGTDFIELIFEDALALPPTLPDYYLVFDLDPKLTGGKLSARQTATIEDQYTFFSTNVANQLGEISTSGEGDSECVDQLTRLLTIQGFLDEAHAALTNPQEKTVYDTLLQILQKLQTITFIDGLDKYYSALSLIAILPTLVKKQESRVSFLDNNHQTNHDYADSLRIARYFENELASFKEVITAQAKLIKKAGSSKGHWELFLQRVAPSNLTPQTSI